jgi:hypothetical protein
MHLPFIPCFPLHRNSLKTWWSESSDYTNIHSIFQCLGILKSGNTECPRRNLPDFGRMFLMLKYTDITQNTYVHPPKVWQIPPATPCIGCNCPWTVTVSNILPFCANFSFRESRKSYRELYFTLKFSPKILICWYFCSSVSRQGTNFSANCHTFQSCIKMLWHDLKRNSSLISWIKDSICLLSWIHASFYATLSSILLMDTCISCLLNTLLHFWPWEANQLFEFCFLFPFWKQFLTL